MDLNLYQRAGFGAGLTSAETFQEATLSDSAPPQTLKRPLMLFRAVLSGLGAVFGAGIFMRFGIAAGQGGMHAPPAQAFVCLGRGPAAGLVSSIGLLLLQPVAR
jgi:hypothetical protein